MQALVQQVAGIALVKGVRVISDASLLDADSGIENVKDPTLRKLLDLEPLALPMPDLSHDMDIEPEALSCAARLHSQADAPSSQLSASPGELSFVACPAAEQPEPVTGQPERDATGSSPEDPSDQKMAQQLVGKVTIRKFFPNHGYFDGLIQSYDPDERVYTVRYVDEDEEQLSLEKLRPYILKTEHAHLLKKQTGKHPEEGGMKEAEAEVENKHAPPEPRAAGPDKPMATQEAPLVVPQSLTRGPEASDDEGDKTESETDLDDDEQELDDAPDDDGNDVLTEDDEDAEEEADGDEYDFRNRKHYCNAKCKLENKYNADEFMLCCEACDEWFHGKCLGLKEGTIADEQVWVCSDNCFEDLPISQRKKDVVVGVPKRKYKKREPKEKSPKGAASDKGNKKKRGKKTEALSKDQDIEASEDKELEELEWSEDYMPHFQSVCEQAPSLVDAALLGRTIMHQVSSPVCGWFPATIKKQIGTGKKSSGKFLVSYKRKATKGLLQGDHETVLDIFEYGNTGGKSKWVLLTDRVMPASDPGQLYCKKSCRLGRDNGKVICVRVLCPISCSACTKKTLSAGGCHTACKVGHSASPLLSYRSPCLPLRTTS